MLNPEAKLNKKMLRRRGFIAIPALIALLVLVGVAGYVIFQKNKSAQLVLIQNNTSTVMGNQNTESSIDTSGWKTYRNEKYGFEVKYPAEWEGLGRVRGIAEWPGLDVYDITHGSYDSGGISADLGILIQDSSSYKSLLSASRSKFANAADTQTKEVEFAGVRAIEISGTRSGVNMGYFDKTTQTHILKKVIAKSTIFLKDNKAYEVSIGFLSEEKLNPDQILSTFKFYK